MASRVTRRYATALYDVARRKEILTRTTQDVETMDRVLRENPRLVKLLQSPLIPPARKKQILQDVFGSLIDPLTTQFLGLLVDKDRIDLLPELQEEFQRLSDEAAGVLRARVESAVPLSEQQEGKLRTQLATITGKTVLLRTSLDPSIKGGAVVWLGDKVIDGSVTGYLHTLESRLLQGHSNGSKPHSNGRA